MTPTQKDIAQMRELTRMTGCLNNVQTHQLKMWGLVVLSANKAEFEFDPEEYFVKVEISNLDYKAMMEGVLEDIVTHYKKRLEHFNRCIKLLLGEEYAVVVSMNGKILGDFPPVTPPKKTNPPRSQDE